MPKKSSLEDIRSRLKELDELRLGELSDADAAKIIAGRSDLHAELARRDADKARQKTLKENLAAAQEKLTALNKTITPDKKDEELLSLIEERKTIEAEIENIEAEIAGTKKTKKSEPAPESAPPVESVPQPDPGPSPEPVPAPEPMPEAPAQAPAPEAPVEAPAPVVTAPAAPAKPIAADAVDQEFGKEGIKGGTMNNKELEQHLAQMKSNPGSLGIILQDLSVDAKKNKTFMLKVAAIDPAYAMHYADLVLKKDEDFNLKVAQTPNTHRSGNPLAEMLPEARTAAVVMAGVKQDYQNIRFARPEMEGYREMLEIAKKAALEKVKALKGGASPTVLVPKVLQSDQAFMAEVNQTAATT